MRLNGQKAITPWSESIRLKRITFILCLRSVLMLTRQSNPPTAYLKFITLESVSSFQKPRTVSRVRGVVSSIFLYYPVSMEKAAYLFRIFRKKRDI